MKKKIRDNEYYQSVLKKEHPSIYEKLQNGKIKNVYQACLKAGIKKDKNKIMSSGIIKEPKNDAREFSPLTMALYKGCTFGCSYCYNTTQPHILFDSKFDFHSSVVPMDSIRARIERDCQKFGKKDEKKQIMLSFTTDPYNPLELSEGITRLALKEGLKNNLNMAILTKAGLNSLRDLDLFMKFPKNKLKYGATLVFSDEKYREKIEPNASTTEDRISTLRILKEKGITTWLSFEPVVFPEQTLQLLEKTIDFVDFYKVGKLNEKSDTPKELKEAISGVDWRKFCYDVKAVMERYNKPYYFKKSLQPFVEKKDFPDYVFNYDYLAK